MLAFMKSASLSKLANHATSAVGEVVRASDGLDAPLLNTPLCVGEDPLLRLGHSEGKHRTSQPQQSLA
jgi:hypothetical protein